VVVVDAARPYDPVIEPSGTAATPGTVGLTAAPPDRPELAALAVPDMRVRFTKAISALSHDTGSAVATVSSVDWHGRQQVRLDQFDETNDQPLRTAVGPILPGKNHPTGYYPLAGLRKDHGPFHAHLGTSLEGATPIPDAPHGDPEGDDPTVLFWR